MFGDSERKKKEKGKNKNIITRKLVSRLPFRCDIIFSKSSDIICELAGTKQKGAEPAGVKMTRTAGRSEFPPLDLDLRGR